MSIATGYTNENSNYSSYKSYFVVVAADAFLLLLLLVGNCMLIFLLSPFGFGCCLPGLSPFLLHACEHACYWLLPRTKSAHNTLRTLKKCSCCMWKYPVVANNKGIVTLPIWLTSSSYKPNFSKHLPRSILVLSTCHNGHNCWQLPAARLFVATTEQHSIARIVNELTMRQTTATTFNGRVADTRHGYPWFGGRRHQ